MRSGAILIGLLLLVSGWLLVLAALLLLGGMTGRAIFSGAGFAMQLLGLGVFTVASRSPRKVRAAQWTGDRP